MQESLDDGQWWNIVYLLLLIAFSVDLVFLQHGRLGSTEGISVRQLIFLLLMLTAVFNLRQVKSLPLGTSVGLVILAVVIPVIWGALGIYAGHPRAFVINDANGQLFYLLAFTFLLGYRGNFSPQFLLHTVVYLTGLLCVCSLLAYLFALFSIENASAVETFLRESQYGFFNVFLDGKPYRIFLSSYLFLPLLSYFALQCMLLRWQRNREFNWLGFVLFVLAVLVLIVSQTRSLWLGFIAGTFVVLAFNLRSVSLWRWLPAMAAIGLIVLAAATMIVPQMFRLSDADGNVGYRMTRVLALFDLFKDQPIFGSGYGAVTTVAALNGPSYSHEMDIIDLLRKLGIVGFSLYMAAFALFCRSAWQAYIAQPDAPEVGILLYTLAVVFTVGFFNPYATASIGIGAIVVALVTLEFTRLRSRS